MIEEIADHENASSGSHPSDPQLQNINKQIAAEENKTKGGKPFLGAIGKSQSSGHVTGFRGRFLGKA
mgnify:CR=1 FL=1